MATSAFSFDSPPGAFRYYDTDATCWASRDPLGMVDGPNVHGYVRGNPIANFDPSGGSGVVVVVVGGGIAIALVSAGWGNCCYSIAKNAFKEGDANYHHNSNLPVNGPENRRLEFMRH